MSAAMEHQTEKSQWQENFPMSRISSWRAGGVARWLFTPASLQDLEAMKTHPNVTAASEPPLFVGYGSNLLVRDGGYDGVIVRTAPHLSAIHFDEGGQGNQGGRVYAEAGVGCPKLARQVSARGFSGAEFFVGIPGTVGGALAMNAGCHGSETWRMVSSVWLWQDGELAERPAEAFEYGYRHVPLPPDSYFVAGVFQFSPGDARASEAKMSAFLSHRRATQPIETANAGSVFANPSGDYAGRLIESCGLKGARVGDAEVSVKHTNFIINLGAAAAADIEDLIRHVECTVKAETGVTLRREVRIVGAER